MPTELVAFGEDIISVFSSTSCACLIQDHRPVQVCLCCMIAGGSPLTLTLQGNYEWMALSNFMTFLEVSSITSLLLHQADVSQIRYVVCILSIPDCCVSLTCKMRGMSFCWLVCATQHESVDVDMPTVMG